jgi:hypothetical protein
VKEKHSYIWEKLVLRLMEKGPNNFVVAILHVSGGVLFWFNESRDYSKQEKINASLAFFLILAC